MLESFSELTLPSIISFLGIGTTILIAAINLRITLKVNRNTTYTSSVTKERIESMNSLKMNSALFNSLIYNFISNEEKIDQKEWYRLKISIEYQLNEEHIKEKEIIKKMNDIIWLYEVYCDEKYTDYEVFTNELSQREMKLNKGLIVIGFKRYVLSLLKIEYRLFETNIKNHIKNEWGKIKKEVDI